MTPAKLAGLVVLVMLAFAANSVLNRMAVGGGLIGVVEFSALRVLAGAVMLAGLVRARGRGLARGLARGLRARAAGAACLSLYLIGFSLAYAYLDAGLGALILFGAVQITMFAGALVAGEVVPRRRWTGAALALAGLAWLIWPGADLAVPPAGVLAMAAAGLGWGLYSLAGRGARDPLAETAANFALAVPICTLPLLWLWTGPAGGTEPVTAAGMGLAVLSGAVTSGLGYALWYAVLPRIGAATGGLVQLTVPVIAALGGVILLEEALGLRLIGAGALVLGGIAYGLGMPQRRIGSSGS